MEDSTLHRPYWIREYFTTSLYRSLPLNHCIDRGYSELRPNSGTDDGSPADLVYSKPFVVLDVIWNLGFVMMSAFVLLFTLREKPSTPLRVWICGYALQCLLHVGFVYYEYQRQVNRYDARVLVSEGHNHSCIVRRLESANTITSSFWWVLGFYWIVAGGQSLLQDSPRLYWLAVVFLALDVFFMIFCIGMACIICVALFCCIPLFAIIYAMTIKEGASEDEIRQLPKFEFHHSYASRSAINEPALQFEDSECCICLMRYTQGAELCILPCNHRFHYGCISRWLRINATCPLCKFNIKDKGDTLV